MVASFIGEKLVSLSKESQDCLMKKESDQPLTIKVDEGDTMTCLSNPIKSRLLDQEKSASSHSKNAESHLPGPDPMKPPCKKAKLLRKERREAKLQSKGLEILNEASKSRLKNAEKSLEDFLNEPLPENAAHKLEVYNAFLQLN